MFTYFTYPVAAYSLFAAIFAASFVYLIRKVVPIQSLKIHHEVGFPLFLQLGVIYGVLLAFIFSITWEQFSTLEKNMNLESSTLVAIDELSLALPPAVQENIRQLITKYIHDVITYEWQDMRETELSKEATRDISKLIEIYAGYTPKTTTEHIFYAQILTQLAQLREYRSLRIFQVQSPRMIKLMGLIFGLGIIVIAISFFFGMEVLWAQCVLTAAMAATIAAIIGMIVLFTRPFVGPFAIQPLVFESALHSLEQFNADHPLSNKPA